MNFSLEHYAVSLLVAVAILFAPHLSLGESIRIQRQGGTYLVPVRINDAITLDFLLDTGASEVTIPADVFLTLLRTHTVGETDFLGTGSYILADGTKKESKRFHLREVQVGNHTLSNVVATVVPVQSEYPLLGQSFLSKISAWSIDNDRGLLIFSDRTEPNKIPANKQSGAGAVDGSAANVVSSFYNALAKANGSLASSFVIPEKRDKGPFSPAALSRFYGNLAEPLRVSNVKLEAPHVALVEYTYVLRSGRRCVGKSLVYLTVRNLETLIERINALTGC